MPTAKKIISSSLLDPTNHALVLMGQRYLQLQTVRPHNVTSVVHA
jgi:hypothetical protein